MPSRVEPCGLNQMYAMRYGTIPIVRAVGGLRDTVADMSEPDGSGFRFYNFNLEESIKAVERAVELFYANDKLFEVQQRVMNIDHSWNKAAQNYKQIYITLDQH